MIRLKLGNKQGDPNAPPSAPPTPAQPTPTTTAAAAAAAPKFKLKNSQPPTPQSESSSFHLPPSNPPLPPAPTAAVLKKPKKPKQHDDTASKKRSAQDDISPAPKRPTVNTAVPSKKKFSIKLGAQDSPATTPTSAARLKLSAKRKPSIGPKTISLVSRKYAPKRPVGVGYDSEASDAEEDPAVESQFILRMEPGPDCDYLREAIINKTLGEKPEAGGAYVNLKFLDKESRRAMVTVNKTNYAAIMVELPCIVEGMKSWDKRGWWKVADICQMLLVLGPTENDVTAKTFSLPREVDKNTYAYAHGLTPPMHWVRKRRFRQRASYKSTEHVDDEVERLLKDDEAVEKSGGTVKYDIIDQDASDAQNQGDQDMDYYDDEEPVDYRASTEDAFGQALGAELEEEVDEDLEGMLGAALADEDMGEAPSLPPADAAAELGAVQAAMTEAETTPSTPAPEETPAPAQEASSDEDDDSEESDEDDDEAPDTIDEELVAEQAVQAQVREEIADLEKEVMNARANVERSNNPMLRQRNMNKLQSLESELAMKRRNFGMEVDDDDNEE